MKTIPSNFISTSLMYGLALAMCMRFFAFGIPATTFPFILGLLICIPSLSIFSISRSSFALIFFFLVATLLHSLLSNLLLDHVLKVLVLCMLFFCVQRIFVSSRDSIGLFNGIISINILFLTLEMVGRIVFGDYFRSEESLFVETDDIDIFFLVGFYKFKLGSPFFLDSNFAAIHAFLLALVMTRFKDFVPSYKFKIFFVFIIIVLTFSRAAVFCYLFFLFLSFLDRRSLGVKAFVCVLISFFVAPITYLIVDDWSLQTKFSVWNRFINHDFTVMNLMFGYGVVDGKYIFGWADGFTSHSLIPSLIGEFGVVGLFVFLVVLYLISSNFTEKRWVFFILIMFLGFSLYDPFEPMLFFLAGLARAMRLNGAFAASRH